MIFLLLNDLFDTSVFNIVHFSVNNIFRYAQLEATMNSVERVQFYSHSIPSEEAISLKTTTATEMVTPEDGWPHAGKISVRAMIDVLIFSFFCFFFTIQLLLFDICFYYVHSLY